MHRNSASGQAVLALGMALVLAAGVGSAQGPAPNATPSAAPTPTPAAKSETKEEPRRGTRPGDVQKVFAVRHVDLREMRGLLRVFPAEISTYQVEGQKMVAVSAAPAVVAAIEETLRRLDVPASPRGSVEVTVWVLEALGKELGSAPLPAELEGVVTQLKRTFSFGSYRLADTMIARGRADSRLSTKTVGSGDAWAFGSLVYDLSVQRVAVLSGEGAPLIRLDGLAFNARNTKGPEGKVSINLHINGDIDTREGQRVVLGKTGFGDDTGNALILVLSVKLAE